MCPSWRFRQTPDFLEFFPGSVTCVLCCVFFFTFLIPQGLPVFFAFFPGKAFLVLVVPLCRSFFLEPFFSLVFFFFGQHPRRGPFFFPLFIHLKPFFFCLKVTRNPVTFAPPPPPVFWDENQKTTFLWPTPLRKHPFTSVTQCLALFPVLVL